MPIMHPSSVRTRLGHLAMTVPGLLPRVQGLYHLGERLRRRPYINDLREARFMMDARTWAQRHLRARGFVAPILQQTYVLPMAGDAAERFLDALYRGFADAGMHSSVVDLMTVPADDHLLSSTRGQAGIAVTATVCELGRRSVERVCALFAGLSVEAADLGGRVHLTKHVFADPGVLTSMYAEGIAEWQARRTQHGSTVFSSRFLRRLA